MQIDPLLQIPSKPSNVRVGDHHFDKPVILVDVSTWKPVVATGFNLGGGEYLNNRVIVGSVYMRLENFELAPDPSKLEELIRLIRELSLNPVA